MNKSKINEISLIKINSINEQNQKNNDICNQDASKINKNLLFFKNDVLKDMHIFEEKIIEKLNAQKLLISEQYYNLEKKINELSKHISKVHSLVLDTNDLSSKVDNYMKFKIKVEDNFNKINSYIHSFKKEYKDYINNNEKLINENLTYPGLIGKNDKFLNFRYFIDYIIKTIKDFNELKDKIKNFKINEFKNAVNSKINDFRFRISDNHKNSIYLLENIFKDLDLKMSDLIKRNNDKIKENEGKFFNFINKLNNKFSEYQIKFDSLVKTTNDNFYEQLIENEKFKMTKNEFFGDMDNFKSYFKTKKKENTNDKIFSSSYNSRNNKYKTILNRDKKNPFMELLNSINMIDGYLTYEEKNSIEYSINKKINSSHLIRKKLFEKTAKNFMDENSRLKISHNKESIDNNIITSNKDIVKSSLPIFNVSRVKINKIIIPENLNKLNIIETPKILLSDNKKLTMMKNNLSSLISKKNNDFNDNPNNNRKKSNNKLKINNSKADKNKTLKLVNSEQTYRKNENMQQLNKNLSSLLLINKRLKNNKQINLRNITKTDKKSLSFDGRKKIKKFKKEDIHAGFCKAYNLKYKIKDMIVIDSKNQKK